MHGATIKKIIKIKNSEIRRKPKVCLEVKRTLLSSTLTLTVGALASDSVSCKSRRPLTKKRPVSTIVFPNPLPLQKIGSLYQVQNVKVQYIKRTSYLLVAAAPASCPYRSTFCRSIYNKHG